jgi:hypothetical protein
MFCQGNYFTHSRIFDFCVGIQKCGKRKLLLALGKESGGGGGGPRIRGRKNQESGGGGGVRNSETETVYDPELITWARTASRKRSPT